MTGSQSSSPCSSCIHRAETETRLDRRRLIRGTLVGAGSVAALTTLAACGLEGTKLDPRTVHVPVEDLPDVDGPPYVSETGKFFLVRTLDGLLAMSWDCTHLGCRTAWSPDNVRFQCPCHGAKFERDGTVIEGPATRPFDLFRIARVTDREVHVIAGPRITRETYLPDQAKPLS